MPAPAEIRLFYTENDQNMVDIYSASNHTLESVMRVAYNLTDGWGDDTWRYDGTFIVTPDGQVYEREEIAAWVAANPEPPRPPRPPAPPPEYIEYDGEQWQVNMRV